MTPETSKPDSMSDEVNTVVTKTMLNQFYTPSMKQGVWIRANLCLRGTHHCGIGSAGNTPMATESLMSKLLLWPISLVTILAHWAIAIPMSIIASILTLKPMMVHRVATPDGVGLAFATMAGKP